MQTAIKSVAGQVGKTKPTIYTVPTGKTALITGQISNLTNGSQRGTLYVTKSGVQTAVSSNITVAASGASAITALALGLESGDSVQIASDTNTSKFKVTNNGLGSYYAVRKVNNNLVAVGSTGSTFKFKQSADDGDTWTDVAATGLSSVTTIRDIAFGGGVYVMAANDGVWRIYTSTDMLAWTSRQAVATSTPYQIKYAASLWVVVSDGASGTNIYTATDPTSTWTVRTSGLANVGAVDYSTALTLWVVCSSSTTANAQIATSPTGTTWTTQTTSAAGGFSSVVCSASRITVQGINSGTTVTSTNGTTWSAFSPNTNVPYGGGGINQSLALGSNGLWMGTFGTLMTTSADGYVWTTNAMDATTIGADVYMNMGAGSPFFYTGTSWLSFDTSANIGKNSVIGGQTISYTLTSAEITP